MIGITPRVQNLHRDLAAFIVHSPSDLTVFCRFPMRRQFSGEGFDPTCPVRCVTARDDQTNITPRALGEVGRETIVFVAVLKSRVHGAHEHTVFQRREAEVEGREQVWVLGVSHGRQSRT